MKFLIVDDSPAMQAIIKRSLEKAGYKDNDFQMADDGQQALVIIEKWKPDLVLTDWHMPNMTGIELLREIQSQETGLKVGLITTETSPVKILEAKKAGALFVLHKPFDLKQFQRTILPVVQGSVEGEQLLTNYDSSMDNTGYDLQLPTTASLSKILNGFTIKHLDIERISTGQINYAYLPFVMALFSDHNKGVIKAICILDIRAAVILGCAFDDASPKEVLAGINDRTLDKERLDNIKRLMKMVSALFYDPLTQQDLDLKSVHMVPKPFDRLDQLGKTSTSKRLDFKISGEDYGEGQAILMAVAG